MFGSVYERLIEFGDCDPAEIVFYPRFFAIFDAATAHLLESACGESRMKLHQRCDIIGWPIVDVHSIFHAPVTYDDLVCIRSRVDRIGISSFVVAHQLSRGEELCVECRETRVWTARREAGLAAKPIPQDVRDALSGRDGTATQSGLAQESAELAVDCDRSEIGRS
jgi:4-hydroxybenzoyl-CoA thioesterase